MPSRHSTATCSAGDSSMSTPVVGLISCSSAAGPLGWHLGPARVVPRQIDAIDDAAQELGDQAELLAFWGGHSALPTREQVIRACAAPGDAWHVGPALGQRGLPRCLDFVVPTWMFGLDPPLDREATSWRISLEGMLVRSVVWRELGGPRGEYASLAGAALELGHRWIRGGALLRQHPDLYHGVPAAPTSLPVADELRFVLHRFGRRWWWWALARLMATGVLPRREVLRAAAGVWRGAGGTSPIWERPVGRVDAIDPWGGSPARTHSGGVTTAGHSSDTEMRVEVPRVSVLIPTLDRYPYLGRVLGQLDTQTVRPLEVVVVDQSATVEDSWRATAGGLELVVVLHQPPGQSTARNLGLQRARGDYVLFLDDDDEIPADLIERHLERLGAHGADGICGVAEELGAGPLPADFRRRRAADVFPTNNGLVRRSALAASGLFDPAFDSGARADFELGLRLTSSGALLVLDPAACVVHLRAPRGGLRHHGARTRTYAGSRSSLWMRQLPEPTELYLWRRFFSPFQAREALVLRVAGTFAAHGAWWRRCTKIAVGLLLLPATLLGIHSARRQADRLLALRTTPARLGAEERVP